MRSAIASLSRMSCLIASAEGSSERASDTKLQLIVVDRPDLGDKGDKGDKEEKVLCTLAKRLCRSNATLYESFGAVL
jgi:hypothetical protein